MAGIDSYTKLMLHMDGDYGNTSHNVTSSGNTKLDGTTKKFGSASMYFDGIDGYLSVPDHDDWCPESGDFTIDFWVKHNDTGNGTEYYMNQGTDNTNRMYCYNDSTNPTRGILLRMQQSGVNVVDMESTAANGINDSNWHHIAIVNSSSTWTMYLDGVSVATDTQATINNFSGPLTIGRWIRDGDGFTLDGYMDEIRISKGIARWTENFSGSLPTSAYASDSDTKLLLHLNGDESASGHDVTFNGDPMLSLTQEKWNGSYYFDGAGDYLEISDHDDWDLGTGDFTIDFWVYPTNWIDGVVTTFISCGGSGTAADVNGWCIQNLIYNSNYITFTSNDGTTHNVSTSTNLTLNAWSHIAAVRNSGTVDVYINGVSQGSASHNYDIDPVASKTLKVGAVHEGDGRYVLGYMEEVRISKGTARWTENFDPPTEPYGSESYKVSGVLSAAGRIIVIEESTWTVIDNDTYTAGSYEIDLGGSDPGKVLIAARKSDGESQGYGNMTPTLSS